MSLKEDFNEASQSIRMLNEQMEMLASLVDTTITTVYELDPKIKEGLYNLHFEKIMEMSDEEVEQFLIDNAKPAIVIPSIGEDGTIPMPESRPNDANIIAMKKNHAAAKDEWKDKPFHDFCRHVLKSIKDSIMEIQQMEAERDKLNKNLNEIQDDYFSYVNTAEYRTKKKERLQKMRDSIEQEPDEVKRNQILRNIEYMEKADSLDFLFDYTNEKGSSAINNIADAYFKHDRSSLIMKKFAVRIPKLGFNKDIYKFFFNLEENFLPEEYHVFNNLFLFHVMRTISYMDVSSKRDNLYASAIIVKLYNLVYHKFGDQDVENEFIEFIRKFDDLFMDNWKEKFEKDNVTHPKHPERIKKDEEAEAKRRIMTIAELKKRGIEFDTNESTDKLYDLLVEAAAKEKEDKKAELEDWSEQNESDGVAVREDSELDNNNPEPEEGNEEDSSQEEPSTESGEEAVEVPAEEGEVESIGEGIQENNDMPPVATSFDGTSLPTGKVARGRTAGMVTTLVYYDKHGYYYEKMLDGTYTYFTPDGKVYEKGFSEETILKLLNTGSLEKGFHTV